MRMPISLLILSGLMMLLAACDQGVDSEPQYQMSINVSIDAGEKEVSFMSPMVSGQTIAIDELVGKPIYIAFFKGGANAGVDLPIHEVWMEVPADLNFDYTCPDKVTAGPYDAVVVIYRSTTIGEAERTAEFPPVPCCGDLAAFTLSELSVRPGEPEVQSGIVRIQVDDADSALPLTNRVPTDFDDMDQLTEAFRDTILVLP